MIMEEEYLLSRQLSNDDENLETNGVELEPKPEWECNHLLDKGTTGPNREIDESVEGESHEHLSSKSSLNNKEMGDEINSQTLLPKKTIIRSFSTDSHTGKPLSVTITRVEHKEPRARKHTFTVFNYGSNDISDLPLSPDSIISQQNEPCFPSSGQLSSSQESLVNVSKSNLHSPCQTINNNHNGTLPVYTEESRELLPTSNKDEQDHQKDGYNYYPCLDTQEKTASNRKVTKNVSSKLSLKNTERDSMTSSLSKALVRSISTDSQKRSQLPVKIIHLEPEHPHKHSFTVFNYGSGDISKVPSSPDSIFSQNDRPLFPSNGNLNRSRRSSLNIYRSSLHSPRIPPISPTITILPEETPSESRVTFNKPSESGVYSPHGGWKKENYDTLIDIVDAVETYPCVKSTSITNKVKNLSIIDIIKRGRLFAKRRTDRLVLKNGEVNVSFVNVKQKRIKFFQDMFTTLLDAKWRYLVLMFILTFLFTWIGFAFVWWIISIYDVKAHVKNNINRTVENDQPCLIGVYNFPSALLFSIETQHTIGYGTRAVTPDCILPIIIVMVQSLVGVILSCLTTGLIFGKFARPKQRAETILFSKRAVLCERDGKRCLMFRVGDMRKSHMISVNIRAILVDNHVTKEEEFIPYYQHNLHIQSEAEDFFFLAWPIRAIHYIDEQSPLWKLSEENLLSSDFEIIVVFEGTNATTGQTTQVKTSYLPSEILWGHKLEPLMTKQLKSGQFTVDYSKFHDTTDDKISSKCACEETKIESSVNKSLELSNHVISNQ